MAELVSIQQYDSPPNKDASDATTAPQWAVRSIVPQDGQKSKEGGGILYTSSPLSSTAYVISPERPSGTPAKGSLHTQALPVTVEWRNIELIASGDKKILKGVSGVLNTGELTAIMGPSGAGKSTLLNVLSGFTRQKVTGDILMNGAERDMRIYRKLSCYIMQDDHVLPHLTVRESIYMAACLKIPSTVSTKEKNKLVEECMESLGLLERQHNKASQLSGGQRKRLCIAQELVSNPPLIFLDEPTSGLDSSSCLQCIQLLKTLAQEGRTVVCTIHQPSARIFEIFDKLYMLAQGQCIYRGPTKELIPFLADQGLQCPHYHNPTDFATEVATGEYGDQIEKLKNAVDAKGDIKDTSDFADETTIFDSRTELGLQASTLCLLEDKAKQRPFIMENDLEKGYSGYATSSWNQFKVLTYRALICTLFSSIMISLVAQSVGLIIGASTGVQNAVFLAPVVSIPILLFSGFFISLETIPSYLKWLSYISYIRYSFQSVLLGIYSMGRPELYCDKIFCPFQEPLDFLKEMDMLGGNLYVDYAALWGFFFAFRFIAYHVLWYRVVYNR